MSKQIKLKSKYLIAVSTLLLLSTLVFNIPTFIASSFFIFYFLTSGTITGNLLLPGKDIGWQILFGIITSISWIVIILSVIYWFFQINPLVIGITFAILSILLFFTSKKETKINLNINLILDKKTKFIAPILIIGFLILFYLLFSTRTVGLIISPWIPLGASFLVIFFLLNILLFYWLQSSKIKVYKKLPFIILNFFIFTTIALILYAFGYGFDPFIHQAAEKYIAENGFIAPKQPYYIGQYVLIVATSLITKLPIDLLDKILVPVFSGIIIPSSTYFAFKKYLEEKDSLISVIAFLPVVVLSFLIVTTPNNLALLLAYIAIVWLWYEWRYSTYKTHIIGITLSLVTASIHPLVGIPIITIYLAFLFFKYFKNKEKSSLFYLGYVIALGISLPVIFFLYFKLFGSGRIVNPMNNIQVFINLFDIPHWYKFGDASIWWRLLYGYKIILGYIITIASLIGLYFAKKRYKLKQITDFLLSTVAGLVLLTFLLATSVEVKNIISYERSNFASRTINLAKLILIPGFIFFCYEVWCKFKNKKGKYLLSILASILLTTSLYFTYPTRDSVSKYTGYNVRAADVEAVNFIDDRNNNKDYIVVANQMLGAAALHEFGFAKYHKTASSTEQYFYSIPTGARLYDEYFGKMVYEKPKKKWMIQAMNFAEVDKAYFIHTNYWYPAGKIRDQAKKYADNWWEFGNGETWVYEYKRASKPD